MDKRTKYLDGESSSRDKKIVPKLENENFDFELPYETTCPTHFGDNVANSSGSSLRSSLIEMGFTPSLVDKVIEENGEGDVDLLLETLFGYSAPVKSNSELSDSLDSMFDDKDGGSPPEYSAVTRPKEEPDVHDIVQEKRACLLMMKFSVKEVDFAMDKLGEDTPVDELVDFITAAQIAENFENGPNDITHADEEKNEDSNTETLYQTMEKTLRLLEMGFSENEISWVIEKFGSEVPVSELADSIFTDRIAASCNEGDKYPFATFSMNSHTSWVRRSYDMGMADGIRWRSYDTFRVKTEEFNPDAVSQLRGINFEDTSKGKRPKEEYIDDCPVAVSESSHKDFEENFKGKRPKQEYIDDCPVAVSELSHKDFEENFKGKRPKQEYIDDCLDTVSESRHMDFKGNHKGKKPKEENIDDSSSFDRLEWLKEMIVPQITRYGIPKPIESSPCKSIERVTAKPPYFFYGNVANLSHDSWQKISQFLYAIEPEFVNSQFFSGLSRKEGYIHNLPTENRFKIHPESPMTIEDAMLHRKKWWPSWDTRKQLSCISSETSGISQLCNRLGKMLRESGGQPKVEQKREILHYCKILNLVWVGYCKLGPIEPEHLECILGYPLNHTQAAESSLIERLQSLRYCFQTDTLGFHLSVLKSMFPGGLTMFSVFSGIGGAEVALHRLGIRLKAVVSIETCKTNGRILKRWWHNTGQTGELVQIEDIQSLTSSRIESLILKFGGVDLIICQNPCLYFSGSANMGADVESVARLDFSSFNEFVRLVQRARSVMEKKW